MRRLISGSLTVFILIAIVLVGVYVVYPDILWGNFSKFSKELSWENLEYHNCDRLIELMNDERAETGFRAYAGYLVARREIERKNPELVVEFFSKSMQIDRGGFYGLISAVELAEFLSVKLNPTGRAEDENYRRLIDLYKTIREDFPGHLETAKIIYSAALLASENNDPVSADLFFEHLLSDSYQKFEQRYSAVISWSMALQKRGRYQQAFDLLSEWAKNFEENSEWENRRLLSYANCCEVLMKYQEARAAYQKIIADYSETPEGLIAAQNLKSLADNPELLTD